MNLSYFWAAIRYQKTCLNSNLTLVHGKDRVLWVLSQNRLHGRGRATGSMNGNKQSPTRDANGNWITRAQESPTRDMTGSMSTFSHRRRRKPSD